MQRPPTRKKTGAPYWVRFSLVMVGFGGFTSAFVLVVLPKRFVLQAGLIESGITFETEDLPFDPPALQPDIRPAQAPPPAVEAGSGVGPAEQFWADVLPLLDAEDFEGALPVFSRYLADYPNDKDVLREYAVALLRTNRVESAEAVYRRLIDAGELSYRLNLARLLRDRGDADSAIELFRVIVAENPENEELRLELARTLLWAQRYADAISLLRELSRGSPRSLTIRLELAQALHWGGFPEEAFSVVAGYPSHDSGWSTAGPLLDEMLLEVAPPVRTLEEQVQVAIDSGDLALAKELYRRILLRTPLHSETWNRWFDFLQYQVEDLEATRLALMARAEKTGLSLDQRFRLAQLHAWTNHEELAKAELFTLLAADPDRAEGWALLGDLYRWEGDRLRAWDAYQRSLKLSAYNERALAGIREIHAQVEQAVGERDYSGVDPQVLFFRDSDDYRRLDIGVRAAKRWYVTSVVLRAGYRYLDGPGAGTTVSAEDGPFAEVEVVRWWRLGTVRTSLTAGVQQFEALGNEPAFGATLEIPDAAGNAVRVSYAHGPAYPHTATIVSVLGGVRSDDFQLSVYRGIGESWSVAGAATAVSLRGGGTDNLRLSGAATVNRQLTAGFTAGVTSRILTHTDVSPTFETRRLYWDPSAFWSNSLLLDLRTPVGETWFVFGRLSPGFAFARERDIAGTQIVPQFGAESGAGYEAGRLSIETDIGYYRGRAGDYNSVAANLRFSIRP